jgi:hypothetical protein
MSMHLEGPWLNTTGKRKAKPKFATADAKRRHEELQANWEQLKAQHQPAKKVFNKSFANSKMPRIVIPRSTEHIPSLNTGVGTAVRAPDKVYTGTKVKGIGTMHKSNAVPVFSDEEAVEISTMRRG